MRVLLILLFFVQTALSQNLILKNVNIIPMNHDITIRGCNIYIRAGKIEKITPYPSVKEPAKKYSKKKESTAGYTVIDCNGRYVMPGLADMHAHFPRKGDALSTDQYLRLQLAAGVTVVRNMRGTEKQLALRDSVNAGNKKLSPEMYISYVFPMRDSLFTADSIEQKVIQAKSKGFDFIKYLHGLTESNFKTLGESSQRNAIAIAGHAYQSDVDKTCGAGFVSIEHIEPLFQSYTMDSLAFIKQLEKIKQAKTFVCPTLSYFYINGYQYSQEQLLNRYGMSQVSTAVKNKWQKDFEANKAFVLKQIGGDLKGYADSWKRSLVYYLRVTKLAHDAGVPLVLSPDETSYNVPGFAMYEEMKLYKQAGLSNYQVLKSATLNAALLMKDQKNWGSVEIGKKAHLLVLDENPLEDLENIKKVHAVMVNGRYSTPEEILNKK